jgi:hypothetical protein
VLGIFGGSEDKVRMDKKFQTPCRSAMYTSVLATNYCRAKKKPIEKKRSPGVAHLKDALK